jgi:hypothetical protein
MEASVISQTCLYVVGHKPLHGTGEEVPPSQEVANLSPRYAVVHCRQRRRGALSPANKPPPDFSPAVTESDPNGRLLQGRGGLHLAPTRWVLSTTVPCLGRIPCSPPDPSRGATPSSALWSRHPGQGPSLSAECGPVKSLQIGCSPGEEEGDRPSR